MRSIAPNYKLNIKFVNQKEHVYKALKNWDYLNMPRVRNEKI